MSDRDNLSIEIGDMKGRCPKCGSYTSNADFTVDEKTGKCNKCDEVKLLKLDAIRKYTLSVSDKYPGLGIKSIERLKEDDPEIGCLIQSDKWYFRITGISILDYESKRPFYAEVKGILNRIRDAKDA